MSKNSIQSIKYNGFIIKKYYTIILIYIYVEVIAQWEHRGAFWEQKIELDYENRIKRMGNLNSLCCKVSPLLFDRTFMLHYT